MLLFKSQNLRMADVAHSFILVVKAYLHTRRVFPLQKGSQATVGVP